MQIRKIFRCRSRLPLEIRTLKTLQLVAARSTLAAVVGASVAACAPQAPPQAPAPAPAAPAPAPAQPSAPTAATPQTPVSDRTTAGVSKRHLEARSRGDLDAMLADYNEDSFVLTVEGPIKGKAALKEFFSKWSAEFSEDGAVFKRGDVRVSDEVAYATWTAQTAANRYHMATDTFVVRNGKIVAQSLAGHIVPKAGDGAAAGDAPEAADGVTKATVQQHLDSVASGDIERILADYTPNSIILTQRGKAPGLHGIKDYYQKFLDRMNKAGAKREVTKMFIEGEMAFIVWSSDKIYAFATETFVVTDGKISTQSSMMAEKTAGSKG